MPYGRVFRQWDTLGRLLVWVNRGELADLPRRSHAGFEVIVSALAPGGVFGIPVVNA